MKRAVLAVTTAATVESWPWRPHHQLRPGEVEAGVGAQDPRLD